MTVMGADNAGLNVYLALPLGFTEERGYVSCRQGSYSKRVLEHKFDVEFSLAATTSCIVHSAGRSDIRCRRSTTAGWIEKRQDGPWAVARRAGRNGGGPTTPSPDLSCHLRGRRASSASAMGEADYLSGDMAWPDTRPELTSTRGSAENEGQGVKESTKARGTSRSPTARSRRLKHEQASRTESSTTDVVHQGKQEMVGRIRAGAQITVFGGVVQMKLDTTSIRQITGALVDGYMRQP